MKGTATITTRTTVKPVTITEVKNGIVVKRTRSTILVRTDDEVTKSFAQEDLDKRGLQLMRDGKPARVSDFREGDRLTATIITTKPPQVLTEREVQATLEVGTSGVAAPSAPVPPRATPAPEPPTRTLPKTASSWPLLGLASALLLGVGLGLSARRRFVG